MDANNKEFYVRYNINGNEFEAKGQIEDVNRHTAHYTSIIASHLKQGVLQLKMPEVIETEMPLLADNGASVQEQISSDVHLTNVPENPDLPTFYLEMAPKSQSDQVAVILYWHEKYANTKSLKIDGFDQAFETLKCANVKKPEKQKLSKMLNNSAYQAGLTYLSGTREFALTMQGKAYIEKMVSVQ